MTLTQKILARAAGKPSVKAGELIFCNLDIVMGNDITSPVAISEFEKAGFPKVFDPEKVVIVLDHFTPCKDIKSANQCIVCRNFAKKHKLKNFFDVADMGIEHALLPEKGLALPYTCMIGADSHTCTYGALGAFSTGIGSTDMASGMFSGKAWFKVPEAIKVNLVGKPSEVVSGKDVILHLIGKIGVNGANYMSLEFVGEGVKHLNMDDRFTICNMAIEAGAKNGIFEVDDITREYLKNVTDRSFETLTADADAVYAREITIDLSKLSPVVAFPHLPENTKTFDEIEKLPPIDIDQVVIGSCTNGRIEDLRAAAKYLKGRKVKVRTIIFPATKKIYLQAIEEGLIQIFIEAGALVSTPTCGPCLGGHMGILGNGEKCVSSTNRNFVGRMGAADSEVYLASPLTCAACAVSGRITRPVL